MLNSAYVSLEGESKTLPTEKLLFFSYSEMSLAHKKSVFKHSFLEKAGKRIYNFTPGKDCLETFDTHSKGYRLCEFNK